MSIYFLPGFLGTATEFGTVQTVTVTSTDHGNLAGLGDDDHTQYGALAQNETVTGSWTLTTPTIASFVNAGHNHQVAAGGGQVDHGLALTGLADDDHAQYVHNSSARTVTAQHTFDNDPGAPFLVTASSAKVANLDADLLDGAHANATPTASAIPIADGSNKLAAGWVQEVLALADLSDVTAKTGTGTTAVMSSSPSIATPTITGTPVFDADAIGAATIVLGSGSATLSTTDNTHTAADWNTLGAGVSMSLVAGTWAIFATLTGEAITSSATRAVRVQNTTDASAVAQGNAYWVAGQVGNISVRPTIITIAGTKTFELQFYANQAGDSVYGDNGGQFTGLMAIRIT